METFGVFVNAKLSFVRVKLAMWVGANTAVATTGTSDVTVPVSTTFGVAVYPTLFAS